MWRRTFLSFAAAAAARPLPAVAQRKAVPVVGFLSPRSPSISDPLVAAFRQGLAEFGYVEGQGVSIDYRWAEGHYDRLPMLVAELVRRKVAVIATTGGHAAALAAKAATSTIPIVFISGGDPVATGLVASLARPGGNITGVSILFTELAAKRVELLSELVPASEAIALLANPDNPEAVSEIENTKEAARTKGLRLPILKVGSEEELDAAFAALAGLHAGALLVGADPFLSSRREKLVALALHHTIPAMYFNSTFTLSGGLISYGASLAAQWQQVGNYVGRILNGEKPAELPVQQPTKFNLVINLKTAKALGLTVPQSLLQRADEVIE